MKKDFNSSYAIRSRFYFGNNQGEFERKQEGKGIRGVEPAPREGPRGEADRWGRPACTYGQTPWPFYRRAGSVYTIPGRLLWVKQ